MDRRKIQLEMVAESMNDDFSRHLCAAISCLVRETVQEVIAEMEGQGLAAKRERQMPERNPFQRIGLWRQWMCI